MSTIHVSFICPLALGIIDHVPKIRRVETSSIFVMLLSLPLGSTLLRVLACLALRLFRHHILEL
jgi:hypothetical protein